MLTNLLSIMSNQKIYTADKIFTGFEMLHHHALVTENNIITAILPDIELDPVTEKTHFDNAIIVPAFIDLQIYGAYNRLLSVYPDAETVKCIYDYCKSGGAAFCMPTVATQPYEIIFKCIDAVRTYQEQGGEGVLGLHVEGPWINTIKRGAHNAAWIHAPDIEQVTRLLDYGKGIIKIITLAPEICSDAILELIQSYGIVISSGHSNATYSEAIAGFSKGINTATHLFNAMSALQHREPGMVGAILDHDTVCCSIVPDGHHVSYPAIRLAKKLMGERLFVITDAVTATEEGYYHHVLDGDKYTSNGILSGSALTLNKAVQNLVNNAGIELQEALRMCSLYPSRIMHESGASGVIAVGVSPHFTVLDQSFNVLAVEG